MKTALLKDTAKEIKKTFKRFISILLIVLLGVGFFVGIKASSPDMKESIDVYFDNQNVMDIQLISTLGLTERDIDEIKKIEGVQEAEGTYITDVLVNSGEEEFVVKLEALSTNINKLTLIEGRLPEIPEECVVEKNFLLGTGHKIGDKIKIEVDNIKDDEGKEISLLKQKEVTIVGTIESPLYISIDRGSSKLGSGKINYYMYVPTENFNTNIKTAIYITVDGAINLKTYKDEYKNLIQEVKDKIENISEERKQVRYEEIYEPANTKIKNAQSELDENKEKLEKELKQAEEKLKDAKAEIKIGKEEIASKKASAQIQFENAKKQLNNAKKELEAKEKLFETEKAKAKKEIETAKKQLTLLETTKVQYSNSKEGLTEQKQNLKELQDNLTELNPVTDADKIVEINKKIVQVNTQIVILETTIKTIEDNLVAQGIEPKLLDKIIQESQKKINDAELELKQNEQLLIEGKKELEKQTKKYENNKKIANSQLSVAQNKLETVEKEILKNEKTLKEETEKANKKIKEAEEKLEQAKLDLKEIKKPDWYILDRNQNLGYVTYLQDAERIANLAKVFPVVFFVVAALISLTTMTRMVEEQRVQIGTLKALGYTKIQIAFKYIVYAFLATMIGGIIGMIIGFNILPKIVLDMYGMMYTIPVRVIAFNMQYALMGMISAIGCTVGATIYSCTKALMTVPAKLMIPKAPKPGKRVLLEKIPLIWSKLKFSQKVTIRNIFRYKKRFLMTIIGVAGCTALIIAGFALRDSVATMIPSQYGEIFKYDISVSLKDNLTQKQIEEISTKVAKQNGIISTTQVNMQAIKIIKNNNNQDIQLIIPKDVNCLNDFIKLRDRNNRKNEYILNNEGIIITEKLAKLLEIKVGDTITIQNTDEIEADIKVIGITENYLAHYIYMSPELYYQLYNEEIKPNTILANTGEILSEREEELGKTILDEKDFVSGVSFMSMTTDIFKDVMDNMNFVVWILIIAAGLLALVVLYNLANTNISERIRELATIKVLGFYDKEVYDYVNKETVILTVLGIALGLIGGYFLTIFIIKTCELDILMFNPQISFITYIYGIVITAVFAAVVNIITYFALKKINMIESLKSVE